MSVEAFPSFDVETDRARECYERLRNLYLQGSAYQADPDVEHFSRRGMAALFDPNPLQGYRVEVHGARVRRWGREDPRETALREAMRLLLTPGHFEDHSPSSIAESRIAI